MRRPVRWRSCDGNGTEHCDITVSDNGIIIEGIVAGNRKSNYGAWYRVATDERFRTRNVQVRYVGGPSLHITCDENGIWHDVENDRQLIHLQHCHDVDIGFTPATNMLPLRRLNLAEKESKSIKVAYIPLPEEIGEIFEPVSVSQRYTCLELNRMYRYEGIFRDFTADLCIDDAGIIEDYPSLFRRLRE
ncbi:putative glycolipid-binding domain-containing protein [Pantoea agglomerans]